MKLNKQLKLSILIVIASLFIYCLYTSFVIFTAISFRNLPTKNVFNQYVYGNLPHEIIARIIMIVVPGEDIYHIDVRD